MKLTMFVCLKMYVNKQFFLDECFVVAGFFEFIIYGEKKEESKGS